MLKRLILFVFQFFRRRRESRVWWSRYRAYLRSAEWQAKRFECYLRARGVCEICGWPVGRRFQCHHRPGSYKRLGRELQGDLMLVHYWCHRGQHPGKEF